MASVPTWQPSVTVQQAPSVRVSAPMGDMGAPVFAGIDKNIQVQLKQKADDDSFAALDASNKMTMDMLNFVNGENGVLFKKGENAVGILQQTEDFYNQTAQKYSNSLGNNMQRRMFDAHIRPNMYNFMRNVATHEKDEALNLRNQQYATSIKTGSAIIAANYHNLENIKDTLGTMESSLLTTSAGIGWTKDIIDEKRQENNTGALMGAFNVAMDNNDTASAKKLIDNFGNLMDPVMRGKATLVLNKIQQKNDDYATVQSIIKQSIRPDGTPDYEAANRLIQGLQGKGGGLDGNSIVEAAKQQWGKPYSLGADGTDATDCGKFTQEVANQVGGNIKYRTADGQCLQFEKEGKFFTDQSQVKKGDFVFWDVPSNHGHWTPSDDPDAVNSDSSAYKGVTHVGIYDGDGKVIQAGSEGVGYIDINTYPVVGFGKNSGDASSMDPTRLQHIKSQTNAGLADAARIKAQQVKEYKMNLMNQINGAGSLQEQYAVIDDALESGSIDIATANNLKKAAGRQSKAIVGGTPEQQFWAKYERSGLGKDLATIQKYNDMRANGEEVTDTFQKKANEATETVNDYYNQSTGGVYKKAKKVYDEILQDLWNSKTPAERVEKANNYKDDLNKLGGFLDIDVKNDLDYIKNNGVG